jgi:hypothetical protein
MVSSVAPQGTTFNENAKGGLNIFRGTAVVPHWNTLAGSGGMGGDIDYL